VFPHLELRRGCDRVEAINQLCHSLNITNESLHRPDRLNNLTCGVVNLREENPLHTNIGTRLDHLPSEKQNTHASLSMSVFVHCDPGYVCFATVAH
jgi:hypothetical protein